MRSVTLTGRTTWMTRDTCRDNNNMNDMNIIRGHHVMLSCNDPWIDSRCTQNTAGNTENTENTYAYNSVLCRQMSTKEERTCLCEIRSREGEIGCKSLLHNGMTAGDFALRYVLGHHVKRSATKKKRKQAQEQTEPAVTQDSG